MMEHLKFFLTSINDFKIWTEYIVVTIFQIYSFFFFTVSSLMRGGSGMSAAAAAGVSPMSGLSTEKHQSAAAAAMQFPLTQRRKRRVLFTQAQVYTIIKYSVCINYNIITLLCWVWLEKNYTYIIVYLSIPTQLKNCIVYHIEYLIGCISWAWVNKIFLVEICSHKLRYIHTPTIKYAVWSVKKWYSELVSFLFDDIYYNIF